MVRTTLPSYFSPLPHFDERPAQMAIDTIVIHSMYVPGAINESDPNACVSALDLYKVSAHYLICPDGTLWQLVDEEKRAWHAGQSKMPLPDDARENVNHFSIGIELIGRPEHGYTTEQYKTLVELCRDIASRNPISRIVGHDHIAPERKSDPGPLFDWTYLKDALKGLSEIRVGKT